MNVGETIELTKPRRGRPIKKPEPEPVPEQPKQQPETVANNISTNGISATESISNKSVIPDNKEKQEPSKKQRKPRTPKAPKAEVVQKVLEPVVKAPVPASVPAPASNTSNVSSETPKKKRVVKKKEVQEVKVIQEEPVSVGEVVNVLESKAGKKRINSVKKAYEEDDIKYRINLVKSTIRDKQINKTKKENEYLKKKLAELEAELNELYESSSEEEEPVVINTRKNQKEKPIKLPVKQVDENKVQYMSRQDLMRSFGF